VITELLLEKKTNTKKPMLERNVNQRKSIKSLVAVIGLAALATLATWQFYLFVGFKNAQGVADVQGGTAHLWVAVGLALIVCIAGVFLFSRFLRYDAGNEIHITSPGPPPGAERTTKNVL
jgi:hypothetical protein